ncbi:hypothetical protein SAMD00019534_094070 [Acytostelium subglobosum LB1]|uniref:hypothetical protein n=1 Tax=Acytostelium subglobosum LB1 TaxID=1410327 RepID=UPI0006451AEF|nr:hypothetical protein SAMD00019534_094070 [Acytostelium subglobosum LB1]GAM26232.1 hypothetical protein SAMD00019534_094070 [Acytostelium subglobosum LB1]|eukprot:XP_012750786.1 hypothetical protein SAMD00019534_094070 [Acytostelium subglobosum LB1]
MIRSAMCIDMPAVRLAVAFVTMTIALAPQSTLATYTAPHSFVLSEGVETLGQFGFLANGHFDLSYSIIDGNYVANTSKLLICTNQEYNNIASNTYCKEWTRSMKCAINYTLESSSGYISNTIARRSFYTFLIAQCTGQALTYRVSYAFYQADGNQLSYESIPLPVTYVVFTSFWVVLCLAWGINWILFRKQRIKLHRVITTYPITKLAVVSFFCGYWYYLRSHGAVGLATTIFYWIFYAVNKTISCVLLLVISTGWGICACKFEHLKRSLYIVVGLLAVTICLGALFGGFFNYLQFIVYIPILGIIFIKTDNNILSIKTSIQELEQSTSSSSLLVMAAGDGSTSPVSSPASPQSPPSQPEQQQQQQRTGHETNNFERLSVNGDSDDNDNDNDKDNEDNQIERDRAKQQEQQQPQEQHTSDSSSRISNLRDEDKALRLSQYNQKIAMFFAFKWIMLTYLSLFIIIDFLKAAYPIIWVWDFLGLTIDVFLFVCIGFTFRLRAARLYYEFKDEE